MRKLKKKSERKIVVYKEQQCAWRNRFGKRCKRDAVGSSTLCEKHGGVEKKIVKLPSYAIKAIKYDPAIHPMQFLEFSREGLSVAEIAARLEVSPSTLKMWSEKYEQFYTAWEIGKAMHESWWLTQGKDNLTNTRFQTGLFKYLTANKLGYAEKIESTNHNVNENVGVLLIPGQMSVEEWENNNKVEDEKIIESSLKEIQG